MGIAYNFTHMKYPIIIFVPDLIPTNGDATGNRTPVPGETVLYINLYTIAPNAAWLIKP